ncbi:hypothetical protein ABZ154_23290 [Streptomyces sp. NPDC006261]|uniref:hypothetical protein n=1 Tax=Streptomyces sp. NPDC006261 TaxID=3156739 RepID=UPI0033B76DFA
MKAHLAAALGSLVLTAGTLLGAPAAVGAQTAAPHPSTPIDIRLGAGSVRDTLTWYDRSPMADGTLRAVDCNRMWFSAYGASGNKLGTWMTSTHCNVTSHFTFALPGGGPDATASIEICLGGVNLAATCAWHNRP